MDSRRRAIDSETHRITEKTQRFGHLFLSGVVSHDRDAFHQPIVHVLPRRLPAVTL